MTDAANETAGPGAVTGGGGAQGATVLISGASVAGPALAYWLGRHGFRPTVVEVAPGLREGGYAVDFRGSVHLDVLRRMDLLDEIRRHATGGGGPLTFIDAEERQLAALPPEFAGGEVEIRRCDLSRILYERSRATTEYVFGDSLTSLTETADGVRATFEKGAARTFDLVIGADGVHSNVRRLAFGPEEEFVSHLGYYVAGWSLPAGAADFEDRSLGYNEPGRFIGAGRTGRGGVEVFALFASERLDHDRRDAAQQKKLVADAFAGMGWRAAELVAGLESCEDLYFDAIVRADVPRWSTGRVALLGDAAYGATIGGMGTGSAIVGAYVLAGELAAAGGDHSAAFGCYERELRDFVTRCQEGGGDTGRFLSPATQQDIDGRNALLADPELLAGMLDEGLDRSAGIVLKTYAEPVVQGRAKA